MDLGLSSPLWPPLWVVVAVMVAVVGRDRLATTARVPGLMAAALVAATVGVLDASLVAQVVVFLGVLGVWMAVAWRWRALLADDRLPVGVGGNRLVGMSAEVTERIDPDRRRGGGSVRVAGESWTALTTVDQSIGPGSTVRIVAVEGNRLRVVPADPDRPSASSSPPTNHPRPTPGAS